MSLLKCKCCGGDLEVKDGEKVINCPYCGSAQTIPNETDEQFLRIYARGNNLRTQGEFDKAYSTYSQLLASGKEDAEIYWNLLLCKYGITYVDDYDGKKKPTMNRMSMTSILEDDDYKKALELSDVVSREVYETEANRINKIQQGILQIVNQEKPYDVFISYKETDEFGERTRDSILAQEIYDALTKEGYRVFLSRITLSNVIGKEYEPYIYSALYTSKIMVLVATDENYVNSVWVKNEWTRFINMMKSSSAKILIPCYRDMDPYDLPKELRNLQGLDMGKLGFIQDLQTGVDKIIGKNKKEKTIPEKNSKEEDTLKATFNSKLRRCELYIESSEWEEAKKILDDLLDVQPENWKLYYCLLQCEYETDFKNPNGWVFSDYKLSKRIHDDSLYISFEENYNFISFLKFCNDENTVDKVKGYFYRSLILSYISRSDDLQKLAIDAKTSGFTQAKINKIAKDADTVLAIRNDLFDLSERDEYYNELLSENPVDNCCFYELDTKLKERYRPFEKLEQIESVEIGCDFLGVEEGDGVEELKKCNIDRLRDLYIIDSNNWMFTIEKSDCLHEYYTYIIHDLLTDESFDPESFDIFYDAFFQMMVRMFNGILPSSKPIFYISYMDNGKLVSLVNCKNDALKEEIELEKKKIEEARNNAINRMKAAEEESRKRKAAEEEEEARQRKAAEEEKARQERASILRARAEAKSRKKEGIAKIILGVLTVIGFLIGYIVVRTRIEEFHFLLLLAFGIGILLGVGAIWAGVVGINGSNK